MFWVWSWRLKCWVSHRWLHLASCSIECDDELTWNFWIKFKDFSIIFSCKSQSFTCQGEWLALTKQSSSQSIKIWSHCFFQPKVTRSKLLATLAESIQSISVAGSPIQLSIINKKLRCSPWLKCLLTSSFQGVVLPTAFLPFWGSSKIHPFTITSIFCFRYHLCAFKENLDGIVSKSFSSVASNIWNKLHGHLSSVPALPAFRKQLKYHLFLSRQPPRLFSPVTSYRSHSAFQRSAYD